MTIKPLKYLRLLLAVAVLAWAGVAGATTITSSANTAWNTGSTWTGGVAPTSADNVIIADGTHPTFDASGGSCATVTQQSGTNSTGYLTLTTGTQALTIAGSAGSCISVVGTTAFGFIRVSGSATLLNIVGPGAGYALITTSAAGYAVVLSAAGNATLTNTGGTIGVS
jgi:hypothetical protein